MDLRMSDHLYLKSDDTLFPGVTRLQYHNVFSKKLAMSLCSFVIQLVNTTYNKFAQALNSTDIKSLLEK